MENQYVSVSGSEGLAAISNPKAPITSDQPLTAPFFPASSKLIIETSFGILCLESLEVEGKRQGKRDQRFYGHDSQGTKNGIVWP